MPENTKPKMPNVDVLRYFRSTAILALLAVLLVAVALLMSIRVQEISPTEVGVKINNRSGNVEIITAAGMNIYPGILYNFYVLDAQIQKLEMFADADRGDQRGRDDLRIKTVDGSNVDLDFTVTYKILKEPEESVRQLVLSSGLGDAYKTKWLRDYSRSVCRAVIGELRTEEFYDAEKLMAKQEKALAELRGELSPYGLEIQGVIVENFRFHQEYQQKIDEKNLADQEVERQISEANDALEEQRVLRTRAEKQKLVEIATFDGKMEQLKVKAKAAADRTVLDAEAYAINTRRGADAQFVEMEKNAQAVLTQKTAEAEANARMANALEGEGGRNIVKIEYAGRLKSMNVTGQPFSVSGRTERFTHIEEGGAARDRPATKAAK